MLIPFDCLRPSKLLPVESTESDPTLCTGLLVLDSGKDRLGVGGCGPELGKSPSEKVGDRRDCKMEVPKGIC